MMRQEFVAMTALVPDLLDVLHRRYNVVREIANQAPIGRRLLAERLSMSERSLRTEIDFLKEQQFIHVSREGMTLTHEGEMMLKQLNPLAQQFLAMDQREQQLAQYLNIERVMIVAGDSSEDEHVLEQLSRRLNEGLQYVLHEESIVAVLGGSTLRKVTDQLRPTKKGHHIFVAARGGMGDKIEFQANAICDCLAQHLGGEAVPLYSPDYMSQQLYEILKQEPSIQRVLNLLNRANCAIHGIGNAMAMAEVRGMTAEEIKILKNKKAVAETFGYFYNAEGEVVYQIPRLGLDLDDLNRIPNIFAVAGGTKKAEAIMAYMQHAPEQTWLITDEGACEKMLSQLSK